MEPTRFSPEVLLALRKSRRDGRGRPWTLRAAAAHVSQVTGKAMTPSQMLRYESGESTPDANRLACLADTYGVPVGVFFVRGVGPLSAQDARGILIARKALLV